MTSAEAAANCSGVLDRNNGNIQAHDRPLAETITMFPPMLLFTPATACKVTGL